MSYPYSYTYPKDSSAAGFKGPAPGMLSNGQFYDSITDSQNFKLLIKASIQRIIMTVPGERRMLPHFGCNLRKFLWDGNDGILASQITDLIKNALKNFEPRISVVNIDIDQDKTNYTVYVSVTYYIKSLGESDSLDIYIIE